MPNNNPLIEAFKYLFTGSPQYGAGLFSPQNIGNALGRTGQEIQTIMTPTPPPPVDLEPIRVFGQRQAQSAVPQPPAGINMPSGQQQRQPVDWQAIADIGIPALSALIGSVAPGTLPAAAGISTGYTGVREKQREIQREEEGDKDFIIVDPETGEQQIFKVPKKATVQQKRKEQGMFLPGLGMTIGEDGSPQFNIPETKTGESLKQNKIRVRKIGTGETGTIDSDEFDSSLYEKL